MDLDFLDHPINRIETPMSLVCPLGNFAGWFFGIFFILRNFFELKKCNKYLLLILFIGSFMNMNVLIYLIPIFIIEIYLGYTNTN